MKVITVTYNDLGISWGPAVHFLELWNEVALSPGRLDVSGYAPSWTGAEPIVAPGFHLVVRRVPNLTSLRQVLWDLRVAGHMLTKKADAIYIRLAAFHIFSVLALFLRRVPVAVEVNGSLRHDNLARRTGFLQRKLAELSERLLLRRADLIFSVTGQLMENCRAANPKATHVHVDNGVARSLFEFAGERPEGFRFIYVGTFTAWDGADRIVEIARQRPDLSFCMVGDGGLRAELQRTAPPNVEFRGWVAYPDLGAEYARCHAGIVLYEEERHRHTSLSSLKTREYVAAGLPIFSTRVSGQEFIEESGYGLLSSGDLLRDLQTFIDNYGQYRDALARSRPVLFEKYSWAAVAAKTVGYLEGAIAAKRR